MNAQGVVEAAVAAERGTLRRMTEAEFDGFYRRNGRALMNYVARLCGDLTLAEDLMQKAFYQLLKSAVPAGDDEQLRPYMYRIATNVVHDHWRRAKKNQEEAMSGNEADRHEGVREVELRHDFQRSFQQLSPHERAMLWMAHVEGLEHREVAQQVGVGEKSVRVLLHRARKKLAAIVRGAETMEMRR